MKMNSENHDKEAFRKVGFIQNANNGNQYENCALLAEVGGFVSAWVSLRPMQIYRKNATSNRHLVTSSHSIIGYRSSLSLALLALGVAGRRTEDVLGSSVIGSHCNVSAILYSFSKVMLTSPRSILPI